MAFNFDHTSNGDISFKGAHTAFTGNFIFPLPLQSRETHILMTSNAGFDASAIAGLTEALNSKVDSTGVGSAIYRNADNSDLPILVDGGGYGILADSVIPASILNSIHVVCTEGGLSVLTPAKKGDFATVITSSKTYVLTGASLNNDWYPLRDEPAIVEYLSLLDENAQIACYSGAVQVSGSSLPFSPGCSVSVEAQLNNIESGKANSSELGNLIDFMTLSTCTSNLQTSATLGCCVYDSGLFATPWSPLACEPYAYYTTANFQTVLDQCYIPKTSIENCVGWCTYSIDGSNSTTKVVTVQNDGKVEGCLFPSIAITDTFCVGSCSDLANLTTAEVGDVAIAPSTNQVWILASYGWEVLASQENMLTYLNGHAPDGNGCVSLTSDDFTHEVGDPINNFYESTCANAKIAEINSSVVSVESTDAYQSELAFTGLLNSDYMSVTGLTDLLTGKADVGHMHEITAITDLEACLVASKSFIGSTGYSVATDPTVTFVGQSNVLFGESAVENSYNCSVIHSAGKFAQSGDAQVVQLKLKSSSSNHIGDISFVDGLDLVSADIVGFDAVGNNVSYRIEGLYSTSAGSTSAIGESNVITFAENTAGNAINPIITTSSNSISVCMDSNITMGYLLADVNIVHIH